jgi:saccharopine dehydrogenase-like NADP-dependent oxidoreductase
VLGAHGRACEVRALSRVLILGGYGGFGGRLTRRLIDRGHSVLVAGRNLDRAAAFCRELKGAEPVVADRNGDLGPLLAKHSPDLVIDAAGPFQTSDHRVPRACIKASMPYLDLADARGFVTGIGALDAAACDASVVVIAGASSVPALSGAVAHELAAGLDRVCSVEIAISASKRATLGASVVAAILSYLGRPVRLWRG